MEDGKVSSARSKPGKPEKEAAVYVAKAVTGKTNREMGSFFGIKGAAMSEIVKVRRSSVYPAIPLRI